VELNEAWNKVKGGSGSFARHLHAQKMLLERARLALEFGFSLSPFSRARRSFKAIFVLALLLISGAPFSSLMMCLMGLRLLGSFLW
jgi:hypothetical protein